MDTTTTEEVTLYDRVGHETFSRMLHEFFLGVRADPVLHAMYSHDLEGSEQRLLMFLEQYWGGPMTYSVTRGAPMLRMRHMPYKITPNARDRWLAAMHRAISAIDLELEDEFSLRDYIDRAAHFLVNADD